MFSPPEDSSPAAFPGPRGVEVPGPRSILVLPSGGPLSGQAGVGGGGRGWALGGPFDRGRKNSLPHLCSLWPPTCPSSFGRTLRARAQVEGSWKMPIARSSTLFLSSHILLVPLHPACPGADRMGSSEGKKKLILTREEGSKGSTVFHP